MRKIKGVLGKINERGEVEFSIHDFEYNNYKDIYTLLNIKLFTVAVRKIGNTYYDIYCDDEGVYNSNIPAMISCDDNCFGTEVIFGNVFICKCNDEGDMTSLLDYECIDILNHINQFLSLDNIKRKLIVYEF